MPAGVVAAAAVAAAAVALRALEAVRVSGGSMAPALQEGDLLLVRPGGHVRPGDVVVVRRPDRPGLLVVKRAVRRAPGGWWVEGDAPDASTDSRHFGPVAPADVVGRVVLRYWPPRSRSSA